MRRRDKELTDPRDALDVLARGDVLRLAMIADGAPYVVPLSFVAVPGGDASTPLAGIRLWVHSALEGRKVAALRKDPRVCFEVTVDVAVVPAPRACDVTLRYRSVIGEGRAAFLDDPAAKVRALEAIAGRYAAGAPVSAAEAARVAIIEIAVDSLSCKASPPRGR
jgi:nitroimidazol reductase NimA-like FMN-containing flavoprotein (pyridoxamine 5'-phosphate oxidase superfamily)